MYNILTPFIYFTLLVLPILVTILLIIDINSIIGRAYIKLLALCTTIVMYIGSIALWFIFNKATGKFQLIYSIKWLDINGLQLNYSLAVDGLSLFFIILTTFIFPLCFLASWFILDSLNSFNFKFYIINLLLLEFFLINSFLNSSFPPFYLIYIYLLMGLLYYFLIELKVRKEYNLSAFLITASVPPLDTVYWYVDRAVILLAMARLLNFLYRNRYEVRRLSNKFWVKFIYSLVTITKECLHSYRIFTKVLPFIILRFILCFIRGLTSVNSPRRRKRIVKRLVKDFINPQLPRHLNSHKKRLRLLRGTHLYKVFRLCRKISNKRLNYTLILLITTVLCMFYVDIISPYQLSFCLSLINLWHVYDLEK